MTQARELRLNTFQMAAPSHNWAGLWRHPRDNQAQYNRLRYWTEMARTAERGLLDSIFIADVFGIYDVYGHSADAALRAAAQSPSADPAMLVSAMALVTGHIGFGITSNLTYDHPFSFARRFSTLDHLSDGRLGWNIVTGYLESGAHGMGLAQSRSHDERYEAAEDYMRAIYQLWEGSWEEEAVLRDRQSGIFTDPSKVHMVDHDGPYYQVHARALAEPSPQRTPVLYQAGTSRRGRVFAGRHAEAVFLNGQTPPIAAQAVRAVREAAQAAGRAPHDVLALLGATVIVAPTSAEAHDLKEEYRRHLDVQGQLALVSGWTGVDLSQLSPDDALPFVRSNAIQSTLENLTIRAEAPARVRDLIDFSPAGARGPVLVGSPAEVADQIEAWVAATDVDGFNLVRTVMPESLEAIVDLLVPELQSRGLFKTRYREGTLREKLFPSGSAYLPARHPGAAYRQQAPH
ncbi:LLM class flavin-dependent oxidoreductase [Corticibacter populi]|uniref:LLM class flavin-dependent oxidoreductase n=1 Tax=Corticibacter populi TaxID=1550736 RepID=A0A3M6QQ07_9BURK|nr:LLM class flavin-dependent oxidoreductase [Corticibacter populi]RMX04881.1 LLM class flavin-dependent oxidoreductase [Corticibacter populi]RZS33695.1 FMN-dependent oxidoreductase (nitrilotriacetate monooxygenase family) [Corticibacter populi]